MVWLKSVPFPAASWIDLKNVPKYSRIPNGSNYNLGLLS